MAGSHITGAAPPLVSIVIPTYNRAKLLPIALEACLQQTHHHLEIIVVNDGSRDNTVEVLAKYQNLDSRIRVIHKQNEGIPDTVNRGFREARGEYVTWTSDDNVYHPEAIATMVDYLETQKDIMLVYGDTRYIDGYGKVIREQQGGDPELLETDCPIMGCLLFRRAVFETLEPFRRQWKRTHDYDFYRRVYKRFKVARIPRVLYDYRLHAASMTGDHYAMTTEAAQLLDSVAENPAQRRAAWARCWHEIARQAQRENRPWKAVWYYLKASFQEARRAKIFLDALWRTAYGSLPPVAQKAWRRLKRTIRREENSGRPMGTSDKLE